jgi:PAS domain S-box-containing protein
MENSFYKKIIEESQSAYALHRILFDAAGKPCDYVYIEANKAFAVMTGLALESVIDKKVTELIPGIEKSEFDWIAEYGSVALGQGSKEFVQHADLLDKWYKVYAFSPMPEHFITLFHDITNEMKQEEEYRSFFEINLDLLCIGTLTGRFLKVNKEWEKVLGYPREALIGIDFIAFVHPEDVEATIRAMEVLSRGEEILCFINRYRCADGRYRYIEWRARPYGDFIYAAARDMTGDIQSKHALVEQKEQFELAIKGSNDGIYDWNLATSDMYISERWKNQLGYDADEMPHHISTFEDNLHPEDRAEVMQYISLYINGDVKCYDREFRMRHKDGSYRWIRSRGDAIRDAQGKVIRIAGSHTDITDRKELEQTLVLERLRLEGIIKGTHVGTWEWNIETDDLFINDRYAEMLGYQKGDLGPTNQELWIQLTHPEDLEQANQKVWEHLRGESDYYNAEFRMRHKEGRWIWILDRGGIAIRDKEGNPLVMSGIHQDISQRRYYEEELIKAKELAEISNVMKGQFLANMSHEIRTPMNGVMGFLDLLGTTNLSREQKEFVKEAKNASEILLYLINDILDFSKIEAGKVALESTSFKLRTVVEDTVSSFMPRTIDKPIELYSMIKPNVPEEVVGDPSRLRQILTNIIGNAIKFTEKGEVCVIVECITSDASHAHLSISVRDTGIGISQETLKKLFKPFVQADATTSRKYGGTGLGLSITYELVNLMGGEITVDSKLDVGSTFKVTLELPIPQNSARIQTDSDLTGVCVLIVDSHLSSRSVMRTYLSAAGCTVFEVESFDRALGFLMNPSSSHVPIDVLLIDYHLPDINGYQMASALQAMPSTSHLKLLLLASAPFKGDAEDAKGFGFSGYLTKPIRRDDMIKAIGLVLGKGEALSELEPLVTQYTVREYKAGLKPKILLVEDNEMNQKIVLKILKTQNLTCDLASSGEEAIEALNHKSYDVIFMDCQMPGMDGYECTQQIRLMEGADRHTPIVAMTANVLEGDKKKCLEAGMDDYLGKPMDVQRFFYLIHTYSKTKNTEEFDFELIKEYVHNFILENALSSEDEEELFEVYKKQLPDRLRGLGKAIEQKDASQISRFAHQIKGSIASLKVGNICQIAERIEVAAIAKDISTCEEGWKELLGYFIIQ